MKRKLLTLITFLACAAMAVQAQVASWDFSTLSEEDKTLCASDGTNWLAGTNRYCYKVAITDDVLQANSTELTYTKGLKFTAGAPSDATKESKAKIRFHYGNGYLQLNGSNIKVTIPAEYCKADYIIAVKYATASSSDDERGISLTNATALSGSTSTSYTTPTTLIGTVTSEGAVTLTTTGGINVWSITVYRNTEKEVVTIGDYGVNTFSSSNALDFTDTGITPYVASSVNGATVNLSSAYTKIPAETGLIIKGDKGTYIVPVTTESETISTSEDVKLVAVINETTVSKAETGYNYIFGITGTDESTIGFYEVGTTDATLSAGKAYLWTNVELSEGTGAKYFALNFDGDSDVTGISNVAVEKAAEDGAYYTLSGVRVAQPTKGLYIHNGKKVVIK